MGVFFAILWPGNTIRFYTELHWLPDFLNYSLIDKIAIGITSTAHNFIFGDAYIFWVLITTIFIYVFTKNKLTNIGIIYGLLFCCSVFALSYYFSGNFNGSKGYGINYPDFINYNINYGNLYHTKALACSLMLLLVPVIFFFCFFTIKLKLILSFIYLLGLFNRITICLSPTIYASNTRTFFIFYISIFICTAIIIYHFKCSHHINSIKFNFPSFISYLLINLNKPKTFNLLYIFIFVFTIIAYYHNNTTTYIDLSNTTKRFPYNYSVDKIESNSKYLIVSGWIVNVPTDKTYYPKYKFVLFNIKNPHKSILVPHFSLIKRPDVSSFYENELYDNTGFKTYFEKKFINHSNDYKLGVLVENAKEICELFLMSEI